MTADCARSGISLEREEWQGIEKAPGDRESTVKQEQSREREHSKNSGVGYMEEELWGVWGGIWQGKR